MSRKIEINENCFAVQKSLILGNRGESLSRVFEVTHPKLPQASVYMARFKKDDSETVYETQITNGKLVVPEIVLYKAGEGVMQWVAEDDDGMYIAKSDLIKYTVLESLDFGIPPEPVSEDVESAIAKINETKNFAIEQILLIKNDVISAFNDILSSLQEVVTLPEQESSSE